MFLALAGALVGLRDRRGRAGDVPRGDSAAQRVPTGGDLDRKRVDVLRRLDPDGSHLPRRSADRRGRACSSPASPGAPRSGPSSTAACCTSPAGRTGKGFVYDARDRRARCARCSSRWRRRRRSSTTSSSPGTPRTSPTRSGRRSTACRSRTTVRPASPRRSCRSPAAASRTCRGRNNLNGIDATPDGKTLVVVQSVTGKLFRDRRGHRRRRRRSTSAARRS